MPQSLHIAIIGGGAAGFFAAIEAKRNFPHADITIFEKNSKVLAKVEITGGGRCNLTNSFDEISDLKQAYPRGHKLMKRLFKRFDYQHAFDWFEENGVPLVTQEDQCVFPQTQDSHSIINCLVNTAKRLGVKIQCNHQLTAITELEDERLLLDFKRKGKSIGCIFCLSSRFRNQADCLPPGSHHHGRSSEDRELQASLRFRTCDRAAYPIALHLQHCRQGFQKSDGHGGRACIYQHSGHQAEG